MTWLFVLFVLVHVVMVLASGFRNNMRAMFSGWYAVTGGTAGHEET